MRHDRVGSILLQRLTGVLLLSASFAVPAADTAGTGNEGSDDTARPAQVDKPTGSRRGPALDDTGGMVYVITSDDIRRSGADVIRPVPGLDIVGRFEGSTRAR